MNWKNIGVDKRKTGKWLTNLLNLNVDFSWYTHYRSEENPDLGATSDEVLRILLSIGGVEIDHFSLWHDKAGNAVSQPLAGVIDPENPNTATFPDLSDPTTPHSTANRPEGDGPGGFVSDAVPGAMETRPALRFETRRFGLWVASVLSGTFISAHDVTGTWLCTILAIRPFRSPSWRSLLPLHSFYLSCRPVALLTKSGALNAPRSALPG